MPADLLPERAGNQWCDDHAHVDENVENLERHRPPEIVWAIKITDLRCDIPLEGADTKQKRDEREDEGGLDRHQEMSDRHQDAAEHECASSAKQAVGKEAAKDRRKIDQCRVGAEDRRRERLALKAMIDVPLQPLEPNDLFHPPRDQQII